MKKMLMFVIIVAMFGELSAYSSATAAMICWFPPEWVAESQRAKAITDALTKKSGLVITPRIAKSYPEILRAFESEEEALVYAGSFVQAILQARALGTPLVQSRNGREFYAGIMVYPQNEEPQALLAHYPAQIAFAAGASSGESSAKAATGGKAALSVADHLAAVGAVKSGKAQAAFVKNWWWADHHQKFPDLTAYHVPGISLEKHPDNILTAAKSIPVDLLKKIQEAALASKDVFNAKDIVPFDKTQLEFSLALMQKAQIDPLTYNWK